MSESIMPNNYTKNNLTHKNNNQAKNLNEINFNN